MQENFSKWKIYPNINHTAMLIINSLLFLLHSLYRRKFWKKIDSTLFSLNSLFFVYILWRWFKNIQRNSLISHFITSAHNIWSTLDLPRQTRTEPAERHCLPCTVFKRIELAEFTNFDALPTNLISIKNEYLSIF